VIPSYVAALALLGAFGPKGLLQQLVLGPLGVERLPEIYGFPGAVIALTLSCYPYVYLLTAAALRSMDPSLEEASRGLGRSSLATFFRVTLPGLRPSLAAGSLLVALYTLSDFGAVSLMQYQALTRAIFLQYKALFDRTPAAILALVLVVFTAIVLLLEERTRRGRRFHGAGRGSPRPPRRVELGAWRWPALAFVWIALGIFLLVPLAVLGFWLARGISRGEDMGGVWLPALDSLWVSLVAAGAVTLAALPVAMLTRVSDARWTRVVSKAAYVPNALPGIVIALALVFFAARYAAPVYQTIGLLLFAYGVRFLPQALAGSSSALAGVSPRLEEAALGLGRRPLAAFVQVTLPLARAGILAGAALVFLSTMKELPATLLLRPIGFETLATEVWKHTSTGSYSQAALPALLLVLVASPFVYFLMGRREPAPSD
jgi:iron(III) transport system permease protein